MSDLVKVPTDLSGRHELLAVKPAYWEFLYFGAVLHAGLQRTEAKWRDYRLGVSMSMGQRIPPVSLVEEANERLDVVSQIVTRMDSLLSDENQVAAFGEVGVAGDEALIAHLANRLIDFYEQILDWCAEIRGMRLDDHAIPIKEAMVAFVHQPIRETREFVARYIRAVEAIPPEEDLTEETLHISLTLTFEVPKEVGERFQTVMRTAVR